MSILTATLYTIANSIARPRPARKSTPPLFLHGRNIGGTNG